jgi:5-methylcytosine-specific restriction endonuclease McrA
MDLLKPHLVALQPKLGYSTDERQQRQRRMKVEHWQGWYHTRRWAHLRWSVLVRDLFTCQICGQLEADTSRLVCDHVEPHRGDAGRFWAGPFQTLCKSCHDSVKQREEQPRA